MNVFASRGWYRIRGRGWAAVVVARENMARDALVGNVVTIDGEEMVVTGVESYALASIRGGDEISLLVKPLDDGRGHCQGKGR